MKSVRHLVLGATRSGKTRFALKMAKELADARERATAQAREVIYVATAEPRDAEMRERIARHRAERPSTWRTLEAPRELARALARTKAPASPRTISSRRASAPSVHIAEPATSSPLPSSPLQQNAPPILIIDCLTLWLSNALLNDFREEEPTATLPTWSHERDTFMRWLAATESPVILVSNEVGGGIVPASAVARRFQSEQGWLNQDVANLCEEVTLVVAGLPVPIKRARTH